jgi:hypothetical protein
LATARFTPNPEDSAYAWVRIRYADGASTSFAIVIANPAAISWRMDIGPDAQPGGSAPPPAQP